MNQRENAISLLKHYFNIAGVPVNDNWDHQVEIEEIVDCIIGATISEIESRAHIQKERTP